MFSGCQEMRGYLISGQWKYINIYVLNGRCTLSICSDHSEH